jgi:nucleotide-binding universal stress UspA family protein
MRSILLHIAEPSALDGCLQTALSIGRATRGHITCLHTTPIEAYVAFDSFGGVFVMEKVMQALDEQERTVHAAIEERLRGEDVSWDYHKTTTSIVQGIAAHAALADLVIAARPHADGSARGANPGWLGDLVVKSRTPILVPGDDLPPLDPFGKAAIAWNGSYEAANAVRAALPLLKLAGSVDLLQVEEEEDKSLFPSTRLLEYLSRHDVHANLVIETVEKPFVADALAGTAADSGASYIVMGGYGHSRIGEYIFGGVTRTMLTSCPSHVLIAH